MFVIFSDTFSYNLEQFGYGKKYIMKLLQDNTNQRKQLFAYLIVSLKKSFIQNVKADIPMKKIPGVKYLTVRKLEKICDYKKGYMDKWKSKEKQLLLKVIPYIPESYLTFLLSFIVYINASEDVHESLQELFAKPQVEDMTNQFQELSEFVKLN